MLVLNDPEITSLGFKLKVAPARSRNVVIQYFAHEKIPSLLTVQGATTVKTKGKKKSLLKTRSVYSAENFWGELLGPPTDVFYVVFDIEEINRDFLCPSPVILFVNSQPYLPPHHRVFKVARWHVWQGCNLACRSPFPWAEIRMLILGTTLNRSPLVISLQGDRPVAQITKNIDTQCPLMVLTVVVSKKVEGGSLIWGVLLSTEVTSWAGNRVFIFHSVYHASWDHVWAEIALLLYFL